MKKVFWIAIFLLAVVALIFFFNSKKNARLTNDNSNQTSSANQNSNSSEKISSNSSSGFSSILNSASEISNSSAANSISSPPENLAAKAGEFFPATNAVADLPPETLLQNVRHAVQQYGEMFGGNPVGLNSEITAALAGKNPKQINFIDPSAGMRVNANGELVDGWGTPYFFHQLSGTHMEIHSAGPDKKMWTSDDLVTK
jgi:hypothetical protein